MAAGTFLARPAFASEASVFEAEILPIFQASCFDCHSHQSPKIKGGLVLDSYAALMRGGDGGPVVVPGDPEGSRLLTAVRRQDPEFQMPPSRSQVAPLEEEAIERLVQWIESGASGPAEVVGHEASARDKISEEDRQWWAFRAVEEPAVPLVEDQGWSRNPVDHFIYRGLQKQNLSPAPEAGRRTLIRRLYLDLLGFAPDPAEVEAFLADSRPDAYEHLVDRLLDSPHYGERQARHWLDLVRFAESDGYKADHFRPHAWRYRDYVVRSFNEDKPYDRFVQEQLAGDELFPDDPDAIDATAFLRLGIYEYNNRDVEGQWVTILNDLTDITGDVFMGLGVSCARCHDHKYDPILQKDYYRLQAFFAPILPRDDIQVATPQQRRAYTRKMEAWRESTREIRTEIEAIEQPYKERAARGAIEKFPQEIQDILALPETERTPYQTQIADLAYRQVLYEHKNIGGKIKGEEKERLEELRHQLKTFESLKPAPLPIIQAATDLGPTAPPVRIPKSSLPPVEPGFPTLFEASPADVDPTPAAPHSTGRRAALARWLTRPGNPLTSRVMVNRVWQHHFGRGIVPSASDFGKLGSPPSHPELLDWLAHRFVDDGWSLKGLHRLLVTSATYRQSSSAPAPERALMVDPENRLLWRMPLRRMDAEQLRDSLLAATGELSPAMGGPSVGGDTTRRSIYTRTKRNTHDPLLEAFDQPDGINSTPKRSVTTTPTQALLLFNDPDLFARARALAARVDQAEPGTRQDRIRTAVRFSLGRNLESWELDELSRFVERQEDLIHRARRQQGTHSFLAGKMPGWNGAAARFGEKKPGPLSVPANESFPTDEFTIEAVIQVDSVYKDASVRTIAAHWEGSPSRPGWSLGVTGQKSQHKPQHLVLQLAGNAAKGGRYEPVFSSLKLELDRPYYVAAAVRPGETNQTGITFYARDLARPDAPVKTSHAAHGLTGDMASPQPFTIGGRAADNGHRFDGLIGEVRLSRRALPEEQLLIRSGALAEDVVGHWTFAGEESFYQDASRAGNHLHPSTREGERLAPGRAAFVDLCHVLLNANEFLYID